MTEDNSFSFLYLTLVFTICFALSMAGCAKKNKLNQDLTLSQNDILLLIQHKRSIDAITKKYDKKLQKAEKQSQKAIVEEGKREIDRYLTEKGIEPISFMKKSKKILEGYLAFRKTSEDSLAIQERFLRNKNIPEEELKAQMESYKKANEVLFKNLTADLSDYEMALIKSNIKLLSKVVK